MNAKYKLIYSYSCLNDILTLNILFKHVGAWPSGKAPVFGIGIPGSNPGAPAKNYKIHFFVIIISKYNIILWINSSNKKREVIWTAILQKLKKRILKKIGQLLLDLLEIQAMECSLQEED